MSISYFYLNHDKRQYYHCGLLGWSCSFSAVGAGPGARALAILLSERGSWNNARISVVAESSKEFEEVFLDGMDIEVEVERMLLEVDGTEWLEPVLESSSMAFRTMSAIAIHLRRANVMKMLDKKFGTGKWQRRYENDLKGNTDFWSQRVVEAGNRDIKLLA